MPRVSSRAAHAVVDEIGVDPLRDESFDAIASIRNFTFFEVDQATEFNLPLIAYQVYSDSSWWWIILVYNGITDAFQVTRGTRLRMPSSSEVISVLSQSLLDSEIRTVEI